MSAVFGNKYVQALLVFLAVVGAFTVYQSMRYHFSSVTENVIEETMEEMTMAEPEKTSPELDLTGTHIMANGDVMTGAGVVISDAVIRDDGMIVLPDGSEIEPVFDMRP